MMKPDDDEAPLNLTHYVATFLPENVTDVEQATRAAYEAAERQLSSVAAHFGAQANGYLQGYECALYLSGGRSPRAPQLLDYAVEAAREAWRFAVRANTVAEWKGGTR